jgi:hypothetical protein
MRPFRLGRWALLAAFPVSLACVSAADPPNTTDQTERLKRVVTPKGRIELPAKEVVANSAPAPASPATADNPTVAAGKVKWHKSVEDAQAAAKKSGKPVLLFQMMGYLDKKFC